MNKQKQTKKIKFLQLNRFLGGSLKDRNAERNTGDGDTTCKVSE